MTKDVLLGTCYRISYPYLSYADQIWVLESLQHFMFLEFKKAFTFRIVIGIMKNQSCLPLGEQFYVLTFPCLFMYITSSYI